MSLLGKKVLRELWRIKVRSLVIVATLALAFAMPAGIDLGLRSLVDNRDVFLDRLGLADLEVRLLPEDVANLPDWSGVPGVERAEARLLLPAVIEDRPGAAGPLNAILIFLRDDAPKVNALEILEGEGLDGRRRDQIDQAVVERAFPQHHGVKVGDRITARVGHQRYDVQIRGVAASPEFFIVAANPEYFLPEKGSLAVIYTPLARVYENLGFTLVNSLVFRFEPGADPQATSRAILARLGGKRIEKVINRAEQLSYRHVAIDNEVFTSFKPAISLVLMLLALALLFVNVDRLIRNQRREMGVLLAMGAAPRAIVLSYVGGALVLSALGLAVGAWWGLAFRDNFLGVYAEAHGLRPLVPHVYADVVIRYGVLVVAAAVASTLFATRWLWRATPRSLLGSSAAGASAEAETARPAGLVARATARLPLAVRLGLRNTAQDPRLFGLTLGGVTLTVAVALAYLVCLESMSAVMARSFESQRWTRAVSFLHPVLDDSFEALRKLPDVEDVEPFLRAQGQLGSRTAAMDVSVLGIRPEGSLRAANFRAGRMAASAEEIVLGEDVCRRLGVSVGDSVTLRIRNDDHAVRVVGIKSDVLLGEALVRFDVAQRWMEMEDQATGVFLRARVGVDLPVLDRALRAFDFVGKLTPHEQLVADFTKILQDIRKLVSMVVAIALLAAALFLLSNTIMLVAERSGQIATLSAIGAGAWFSSLIMLTEVLGQTAIAMLLATPLGYGLAAILNGLAGRAWFSQPTVLAPAAMLGLFLGVVALTLAAFVPGLWSAFRLNPAAALRARSIE